MKVYHRCGGCGKKQVFINSEKFRVNANGNRIEVWLIYRCKKCKHSWNLSIYERTRPSKIPSDEYELFMENDSELACKYGNDIEFLKRNNAEFHALHLKCSSWSVLHLRAHIHLRMC
ncbi:MAG: DUF1062 domain-containing protein [Agathobacter sp.]|nr:DUF1062 domain-containing protein [Agathobacter sp.]